MAEPNHYQTLEEVAKGLQVSDQTIRRWIKSGRLPAYKPGREWRIKTTDLEEFLESRSSPKAQAPSPLEPSFNDVLEEERRLSFIISWSNFVDEWAGDVEEWRDTEFGTHGDPADLPEREFLSFIKSAMPFIQAYRRLYRAATDELAPALRAELPTDAVEKVIERFERAVRRLSRAMMSVVTEGVERRVTQMASAEATQGETHQAIPRNVVKLFTAVREVA